MTANAPIKGHRVSRFTSAQKMDAVLRVLRGESVDSVSEDVGASIRRVTRWQNDFMSGGSAELSRRRTSASESWIDRQSGAIARWTTLLLALGGFIAIFALLLQHPI